MIKVLQINNFSNRVGGAEVVFLNSIELLKQNGHDVISFATRTKSSEINSDYSIKYSRSVKSRFYSFDAKKIIKEIIKKEKPDIAHIHNIIGGITYSILPVLKENKIPIIATIHDYKLLCPACNFVDRKNRICEKCIGGKYYNCAFNNCSVNGIFNSVLLTCESYLRDTFIPFPELIDQFIFVSDFERNKFLEVHPEIKIKSSRIYNFTNKFFDKTIRGEYFLSFGRLAVEKGLLTLLDAFSRNKSIKLKIIGEGPIKHILENKKTSNVELLGFKSGPELEKIIQEASFIIVPSEWFETNSLTTVESFAAGKPVIGSDIGALSELIENQKTGFKYTPKDSNELSKLINFCNSLDADEYSNLSKNALKHAMDNFSSDAHYEQLINVYEKALCIYT